jgi:hypothetical protein
MSIVKRQKEEAAKSKKERRFRKSNGESTGADWSKVDAEQLRETIAIVAQAGGALRLGYTIDGGAYALGVYGDGASPYTEYVRPSEDINRVLADLSAVFTGEETEEDPPTRTAAGKLSPTAKRGEGRQGVE